VDHTGVIVKLGAFSDTDFF